VFVTVMVMVLPTAGGATSKPMSSPANTTVRRRFGKDENVVVFKREAPLGGRAFNFMSDPH
jgi:hypothetical protein